MSARSRVRRGARPTVRDRRAFIEPFVTAWPRLDERPLAGFSAAAIVGPFPVFVASARGIVATRTIATCARRRGSRAVMLLDDEVVALVDVANRMRDRSATVRGREPAEALFRALASARRITRTRRARGSDELRILEVPEVFVTAFWIPSRPMRFVPTRLGSAARAKPRSYSREQFLRTIRRLDRLRKRVVVTASTDAISRRRGLGR